MDKETKKIICTSISNGKRHDYSLFKESGVKLYKNTKVITDTGYIKNAQKCPYAKEKKQKITFKFEREETKQRLIKPTSFK